jgi:hypothetical protein
MTELERLLDAYDRHRAEGRACAAGVDEYLSGSTKLPRPIPPTARPMMV